MRNVGRNEASRKAAQTNKGVGRMKWKVTGEITGRLYKIVEAKDEMEACLLAEETYDGNEVDWEPAELEAEEYQEVKDE